MVVKGEFEVKLNSMEAFAKGVDGTSLGRMSINKKFLGELSATSQGEMLTAMTSIKGSAGYVAIEQVIGSLAGKKGSFGLQHFGIRTGGMDRLILEVIPDSGAGELVGLTGKMEIKIDGGKHFYIFEYGL